MNPTLSVLVPVFNGEQYLKKCLDSIFCQTLKDIEVVIADDCSSDGSLKIIDSYKAAHDNVVVIRNKENKGTILTRKEMISRANGQYICFADQDDYFYSDKALETAHREIEKHGVDILQFQIAIDENQKIFVPDRKRWNVDYAKKLSSNTEIFDSCINDDCSWWLWNKIFKAGLIKKGYDHVVFAGRMCAEDIYGLLATAFFSSSFIRVKTPPLYLHRGSTGLTARNRVLELWRFKYFCNSINSCDKLLHLINSNLERKDKKEKMYSCIEQLRSILHIDCMRRYTELDGKDSYEGFNVLSEHADKKTIIELMHHNIKYRDLTIGEILNSKSWKKNKFIYFFIKIIKKILHK